MKTVNVRKLYHCAYVLSYHFVFVTKYRRRCLSARMLDRLREIVEALCKAWGGAPLSVIKQYIEQQARPE